MHILLFIIYGLICSYGIVKLPFVRRSGIKPLVLLVLFFLHVLTGCLHNWIAWRYFPNHGDIWHYYDYSFILRHQLVTDMHAFLSDWTWSYLTHNSIMFIHMLLNCLSFDNLYVNTLLFSFPVFLGNIALYQTFRRRFPDDPLTGLMLFVLPSVLFWTSCIHREALLFMLLGFLLSAIDRLLTDPYQPRRLLFALLTLLLIAFFRGAFALTLLPAIFVWLWLEAPRMRRSLQWLAITAIAAVILLNLFAPGLTIPAILADKQREFYFLEAHSRIYLPAIDGAWPSLLHALPYILRNGCFEPLPGSGGQSIYLAFALELLLIWTIALIAIIRIIAQRNAQNRPQNTPAADRPGRPFSLFCLTLALAGMLLIGVTVPFIGALVRYRSICLPFLLAPFLHTLCALPAVGKINTWLTKNLLFTLSPAGPNKS